MARPKKETTQKRTHSVMLRFNDTEYAVITENAKNANMPTAEYIRRQFLDKPIPIHYEIVADITEIKILTAEMGKIGSNLNQIARYFHQGGLSTDEIREALLSCISDIYEMKQDVADMTGHFYGNTKTHRK